MKTISYQNLIQTAVEFKCFVKSTLKLYINPSTSWIEKAIRYTQGLSNTLSNDEIRIKYLKINNQNSECLWALIQLMDLAFIYNNLIKSNKLDKKVLKSKIKKIIEAPFLPIKEVKEKNEPRNILFELILTGELLSRNFNATIPNSNTGHPDIEVVVNKNIYAIECKRIFNPKAFIRNFYRAKVQLEKYSLNKHKYSFGIIAINITRIFNPGDKLLIAQNEKEATNNALNEVEFLFNQFKNKLGKNSNIKIPALILFLSIPVILKQKPFLAGGAFLTICELPNQTPISLFNIIKSDFKKLESNLEISDFYKF